MSSKRILIVDDDPGICQTLSLALNDLDYAIEIVHSGETALSAIEKRNFSIVLLDIRMAGVDGMEALRSIGPGAPQRVPAVEPRRTTCFVRSSSSAAGR